MTPAIIPVPKMCEWRSQWGAGQSRTKGVLVSVFSMLEVVKIDHVGESGGGNMKGEITGCQVKVCMHASVDVKVM